jgi:hypothetical protein
MSGGEAFAAKASHPIGAISSARNQLISPPGSRRREAITAVISKLGRNTLGLL